MMGRDDAGHTLLETLLLGLLLLVPLIWTLAVLSDMHRVALAATAAVREAGAAAARASDASRAEGAARAAIGMALADHDVERGNVVTTVDVGGFVRGARVAVLLEVPVPVFSLPFLGRLSGPEVWVRASHEARIDPYASRR